VPFGMLLQMGQFTAIYGILLGICVGVARAAVPATAVSAPVMLDGQRKFLDASIALCIERVPALRAELASARNHAEPQIRKAEGIIGEQLAASAVPVRALLDRYVATWRRNADDLLEALKNQNAKDACPTLRDNWLAMEADIILEDWQNFLDGNLPDATDAQDPGEQA
jgi:hypothetical protein